MFSALLARFHPYEGKLMYMKFWMLYENVNDDRFLYPVRIVPVAVFLLLVLLGTFLTVQRANGQGRAGGSVKDLLSASQTELVVVAHRGCHNPAPRHGAGAAPENSMLALEHCISIGADMVELDVRRSADGYLVVMHDESVDRTTNGHGNVADLTLSQLRGLKLRQNLGGYAEPLTSERVPTLDEVLHSAKGRIALNLDVKAPIYAEVVDAVRRAGAVDYALVKSMAGVGSPVLAGIEPFAGVSFMPILAAHGTDLLAVAEQQAKANVVALELPHMTREDLPQLARFAVSHRIKLLNNTLGDGFVDGLGGDNDAMKDADAVWGDQLRRGISVFQTDRPEELLRYRMSLCH